MKGNFIDIITKKIKIRTYFLCPYLSSYFQTIEYKLYGELFTVGGEDSDFFIYIV